MAEPIKFTEEEINQINQLREDVTLIFTQLGQLAVERKLRLDELEVIETELFKKTDRFSSDRARII